MCDQEVVLCSKCTINAVNIYSKLKIRTIEGWYYDVAVCESGVQLKAVNPLTINFTEWSNTLKQFVGNNCLSVFDHFVGLALKGLTILGKISNHSDFILLSLFLNLNIINKLIKDFEFITGCWIGFLSCLVHFLMPCQLRQR